MYLKNLDIFGFKSFPEKTTLKFESGITVVVGPNGCGKSNVFDAIKWALGEQSPKSLRGIRMEDIIFNGTQNYPPLNYAEVTLDFSNEDKYLPLDYNEISISRRLYRSGESQYFINKNVVRLKDVQELFMGTGIGESTYSFVEQGKIEIFLSYKPEDKRLIFDEASGIVKYKERRKETLRRLSETEENLLRLEDVLSEVRRQIRYLERQVNKAKKYKEVQSQLIETENKIAAFQFADLDGRIAKILEEVEAFRRIEQERSGNLAQNNSRWEELNSQIKSLRAELEVSATEIVSLRAQVDSAQSHIIVCEQRIKELEDRNSDLDQANTDLTKRLQLQEERCRSERERMDNIANVSQNLREQIIRIESESQGLLDTIDKAKKEIADDKIRILDFEDKKSKLNNSLIEIRAKVSSLSNRKKRLLIDKARLEGLVSENRDKLEKAKRVFLEAQNKLGVLQDNRNSLAVREKDLASLIEDAKLKLVAKEKELFELQASYEFLKDLRVKYETFSVKKKITVIFEEEPKDINKLVASLQDVEFREEGGSFKAQIEAKVISFEEKQLEDKISSAQNSIEKIKEGLQELETQKLSVNQELSAENSRIDQEREELRERMQEKERLGAEVLRLEEEFELLQQEVNTAVTDIEEFEVKEKAINEEMPVCEGNLDKANENLRRCQDVINDCLKRKNEIEIESARCEAEIQSLYKEKEALSSKITFFQDEINNISGGLKRNEKEKETNDLRKVEFDGQIEKLRESISDCKIKIEDLTVNKQRLDQREAFLNGEIEEVKNVIQAIEKEIQELMSSAHGKKMEMQSLEYEKEKIRDYLSQVYRVEFTPISLEDIGRSEEELSADKEQLQKKIKSLGEVNLVAIEEFDELKKRDEFLDGQKQDLITSKERLKNAIQKINRTSKELFLDTFNKIEIEFKKNFKFLFNGGNVNLVLLDESNVLESGVEIEVQPPGKKSQNISLLSGGEKALTAISLIFAIFTVRPSPLCVLDEIDAPLDEANVDRFNHLLKKFAASSQFILITHNKKTMSNADVLYGVTMQDKGVSKLVSVRFASEEVPS